MAIEVPELSIINPVYANGLVGKNFRAPNRDLRIEPVHLCKSSYFYRLRVGIGTGQPPSAHIQCFESTLKLYQFARDACKIPHFTLSTASASGRLCLHILHWQGRNDGCEARRWRKFLKFSFEGQLQILFVVGLVAPIHTIVSVSGSVLGYNPGDNKVSVLSKVQVMLYKEICGPDIRRDVASLQFKSLASLALNIYPFNV